MRARLPIEYDDDAIQGLSYDQQQQLSKNAEHLIYILDKVRSMALERRDPHMVVKQLLAICPLWPFC
jgi:hypothetical protein